MSDEQENEYTNEIVHLEVSAFIKLLISTACVQHLRQSSETYFKEHKRIKRNIQNKQFKWNLSNFMELKCQQVYFTGISLIVCLFR